MFVAEACPSPRAGESYERCGHPSCTPKVIPIERFGAFDGSGLTNTVLTYTGDVWPSVNRPWLLSTTATITRRASVHAVVDEVEAGQVHDETDPLVVVGHPPMVVLQPT
jgi:hypothetical protein